uniref:uncharacterized protein LOC132663774 isoform X2 n=1 Tax=Panthera onca TaxID=9690 RepID=UPI002952F8C9|nr:uncharacterized protein LOC132663774 isoform X2 [Panthera onca]
MGREVIRAGFERAVGSEARKPTRKRCVSRPTAWRLQGSCVPATPRRPQGRGCTGLHRAAPARPARPRGQACWGLSYVQHLQQDTYTSHKTIFYRAFGFMAILRGKHRVCPWAPALTAGSLPDTPPGAALVADPHGRVVVTQSPECARGRPSRGFGQTCNGTHLPFRLPRGVLAALPSRAHSFVSVPCAGPGRVPARRQVGFRGTVTAVCNRSGSLTVSPRVNTEIPRGTACPLLGPRRKALTAGTGRRMVGHLPPVATVHDSHLCAHRCAGWRGGIATPQDIVQAQNGLKRPHAPPRGWASTTCT